MSRDEIVRDWLPRYTGVALQQFSRWVLLTNFSSYLEGFCELLDAQVVNPSANMPTACGRGITLVNFGMGSPNAATVMDLLTVINPHAVLFLGKCGGLMEGSCRGNWMLPVAAIRGEGTSSHYFPPEVPSLPDFEIQKQVTEVMLHAGLPYRMGTIITTNRRVWEHDRQFKDYLRSIRAGAIDMECATLFSVGFYHGIRVGALLLVSDEPMIAGGVKTQASDVEMSRAYTKRHVQLGVEVLSTLAKHVEQGEGGQGQFPNAG